MDISISDETIVSIICTTIVITVFIRGLMQ